MVLVNLMPVAKVVMDRPRRWGWLIALSALLLGLMLGLMACAEPEGRLGDSEQAPTDEAATSPAPAQATPTEVSLTEYEIEMSNPLYAIEELTSFPAGSQTFRVTNNGTTEHNFEVEGQGIEEAFETNLSPGETRTMQLNLGPGTYVVYCPVGNHREQGMEVQLTVTQ
jgi:plastocyanin